MRIVFMGTPDFRRADAARAARGRARDRRRLYPAAAPGGAGQAAERQSPVHLAAEKLGIPVRHPAFAAAISMRRPNSSRSKPIWRVVAAYGLILPKAVLDSAGARLPQRPRQPAAALARGGADPARDPGRRPCDRRDHHADGGRARHRADAGHRARSDRGQDRRRTARRTGRNRRAAAGRHGRRNSTELHAEPQAESARHMPPRSTRPKRASTVEQAGRTARTRSARLCARSRAHGSSSTASGSRCCVPHVIGVNGAPGTVLDDELTIACGDAAIRPRAGPARGQAGDGRRGSSCAGATGAGGDRC